jgi:hypothetical protein
MGTVNDPNFWKRFSVAVHNDDASKADLKHSYVITLDAPDTAHKDPSPVTTPTSEAPLSHSFQLRPLSPTSPSILSPSLKSPGLDNKWPLSSPLASPTTPRNGRLQKARPGEHRSPARKASPPVLSQPRRPSLAHILPFTHHNNSSQMTLGGITGRPASRFKFWTSISADPTNRDSWLEGQRRKRKQRTWICWAFWLGLAAIVGGVVATVLILRQKGIL